MTARSYSTSFLFITLCFKESFFTEVGIKPLTAGVVILMSCLQCNCCCGSQHISVSICYFSFHLPTFIIDELQKMLEDVRFSKGDSREGKEVTYMFLLDLLHSCEGVLRVFKYAKLQTFFTDLMCTI